MQEPGFYKTLAIISPLISGALTSIITYYLALKTKKSDISLQNRLSESKQIVAKLADYKVFCHGRIAFLEGNEFSPVWEEREGTLMYRREIFMTTESNNFYLSRKSKEKIKHLLKEMSVLSNVEAGLSLIEAPLGAIESYTKIISDIELCIDALYADLS